MAFVIFTCLFGCNTLWAQGAITNLTTTGTPPSNRNSLGIAPIGNNIYLFGGTFDNFSTQQVVSYNDLYVFKTQSNAWVKLNPVGTLPPPRGFSVCFGDAKNNILYMFGGTSFKTLKVAPVPFKDLTMFNDLWVYSVKDNKWKQITTTNGPSPRAKSIGWFADGKIYIFGGVAGDWNTYNDLWMYDVNKNAWTQLIANGDANSPPTRQEAQGGLVPNSNGTLAVIYGGEKISSSAGNSKFDILNDTWEYNIKTNQWKNITPVGDKNIYPVHTYSNAALIGNYFYIQSGDLQGVGSTSGCGAPFPQSVGDDLWRFDLTSHVWQRIGAGGDALPRMKRTAATSANDKMYMFLGYDFICENNGKPGQIWIKNVYMYDPSK